MNRRQRFHIKALRSGLTEDHAIKAWNRWEPFFQSLEMWNCERRSQFSLTLNQTRNSTPPSRNTQKCLLARGCMCICLYYIQLWKDHTLYFFMEIAQAGIYENTCTGKTTSLMTPTHSNDKIWIWCTFSNLCHTMFSLWEPMLIDE